MEAEIPETYLNPRDLSETLKRWKQNYVLDYVFLISLNTLIFQAHKHVYKSVFWGVFMWKGTKRAVWAKQMNHPSRGDVSWSGRTEGLHIQTHNLCRIEEHFLLLWEIICFLLFSRKLPAHVSEQQLVQVACFFPSTQHMIWLKTGALSYSPLTLYIIISNILPKRLSDLFFSWDSSKNRPHLRSTPSTHPPPSLHKYMTVRGRLKLQLF